MNSPDRAQPIQGVPVMLVAQPVAENDIKILDLYLGLLRRKWLIVAITATTTIIGILYSLWLPRIYQAETSFLPPTLQEIEPLRLLGVNLTPQGVYDQFTTQLDSKENRRDFFQNHGVLEKLAADATTEREKRLAFNGFDNALKRNGNSLTLEGKESFPITGWLNDFARQSAEKTRDAILSDIQFNRNIRETELRREIDEKIRLAAAKRADRITRLKEALVAAKSLDIKDYPLSSFTPDQSSKGENTSVAGASMPLYMYGTKALIAELKSLQTRQDDRAFIPGIRDLEQELHDLEAQHIDPERIQVMRIYETAIEPSLPVKPKRKLIVLAAFILGFFISVMTSLVAETVSLGKR